jgi:hypothetical protein
LIEFLAQEAVINPAEGTANRTSAIRSGRLGARFRHFSSLGSFKVGAERWESYRILWDLQA